MKNIFIILIALVFISSCTKDSTSSSNSSSQDTALTPYSLHIPPYFPKPYLPSYNPMTVEGVELGRRLFYDSILSSNGRSCSYCHPQSEAFTSTLAEHGLDPGVYPNIPVLVNEAWNPCFGWDGAFPDADHVAVADFTAPFFNSDVNLVISKLKADPMYSALFKKVFHGQDVYQQGVIQEKVAFAVAQFARTLLSYNSKFDKYMMGMAQLTPQEERGKDIFMSDVQYGGADCFHCHNYPLWTDNGFHNTGNDSVFNGFNRGRFNVTGLAKDIGLFRSPTLRNIALTAPYMHDGRYKTLDEVIEHYNSGVHKSATIDPIMTLPGKEMGLQLSTQKKQDLIAFLQTLTDTSVLSNPDYGRIK